MVKTVLIRIRKEDMQRIQKEVKEEYLRHNKNMIGIHLSNAKLVYEMIEFYLRN